MAYYDKWLGLFDAAELGDEERIKSLLAETEEQIQRSKASGEIRIYFGCNSAGYENALKCICESKELLSIKNKKGDTPLHIAVFNGHENTVKLLLGINQRLLFIKDKDGCTPLHIAVMRGNVEMVEILQQNGAPLNYHDKRRNCPLILAIYKNHPKMVTSLISHGKFRLQCHSCKLNLFHVAVKKNLKPIVQILLKYATVFDICSCSFYPDPEFAEKIFYHCLGKQFARDIVIGKRKKSHKSVLHFAAYYGRIDQVKKLIEFGARVNEKAYRNWKTPLHEAVLGKNFEASLKIIDILLKNGASVHAFDNNAKTPLHYAVEVEEFRPEKIRLLLDHKAVLNANLFRERTPIFFTKCGAILQMLIDRGANVNYGISEGWYNTTLHNAIYENNLTKVDILLENGAEIDRSTIKFLNRDPEINERVIDGMRDITLTIETLLRDRDDDRNIIPILAKRHFQGEITLNSEEFFSASGIFFAKFKECQEELERMREINVLNLSLFDILVMPIKKLRSYATKEEVLNVFESGTIQDKFPVYSGMIMRRFKKAKEERDLIDSSSEALQKLVFSFHKIHLPDLVVYEIMGFLHMVDRKKLVEL